MIFSDVTDLTASFTAATTSFAGLAGETMALGAVFDLASDRKDPTQDPDLKPLKSVAKMFLAGMTL